MSDVKAFFEKNSDEFWAYLENTIYEMGKNDEEYMMCSEQIEKILSEHPNLRKVLEDEEVIELTKEDIESLIELKEFYINRSESEMKNLFYLGGQNLYYYLDKTHILDKDKLQ